MLSWSSCFYQFILWKGKKKSTSQKDQGGHLKEVGQTPFARPLLVESDKRSKITRKVFGNTINLPPVELVVVVVVVVVAAAAATAVDGEATVLVA